MNPKELAQKIDHTVLKPEATAKDFENLCEEARDNGFYAVCVPAQWVAFVKERLKGCPVKIASVVGFPHGNTLTDVKVREAEKVIDLGADEIDMVIQIGKLSGGDVDAVKTDIEGVVKAAKAKRASVIVKVILETGILSKAEKVLACRLAADAGASFVVTSTDFHPSGEATVFDVGLLRENSTTTVGVKASGGIRDLKTAMAMIGAGAARLGCSASVDLVNELEGKKESTAAKPNLAANKSDEFQYAWAHFDFHAKQRQSMFNYFLLIAAALLATLGWLIGKADIAVPQYALLVVAVIGAVIIFMFIFLDLRNRDLVHRGERVLKRIENREFFLQERMDPTFNGIFLKDTGMERIRWTEGQNWVTHGVLLRTIELLVLILIVFLAGMIAISQKQSSTGQAGTNLKSPPVQSSPGSSTPAFDQKEKGK